MGGIVHKLGIATKANFANVQNAAATALGPVAAAPLRLHRAVPDRPLKAASFGVWVFE
jgi:hypothetical protein